MTTVIHTQHPGLAGTKVPHPVAEPESCRINVVYGSQGNAGLMFTFTTNGKDTAYFLGETELLGVQHVFSQAIPIVMQHNKPKGDPS